VKAGVAGGSGCWTKAPTQEALNAVSRSEATIVDAATHNAAEGERTQLEEHLRRPYTKSCPPEILENCRNNPGRICIFLKI
jgi:hypothetical protein